MKITDITFVAAMTILCTSSVSADTAITENGGDTYSTGSTVLQSMDAGRDVFAAGRSTTLMGRTVGDLHASGFDVKVAADVGEDAYAVGATVAVAGTIGKDLSAAGYTVRLEAGGRIAQNARLFASSITIEAPIGGSLTATGRDIYLNAPVGGDALIMAETLRLGPDAKIDGGLTYSAKEEIQIPPSVVPAGRVQFEKANVGDFLGEMDQARRMPILPSNNAVLLGFLVTLLFFVILGAIALGFFPNRLEQMRRSITNAFSQTALLGVIGLALLFGAIPVTALTIVGIPFVPIWLLAIVVVWIFAYALGAYAIATRLWTGLGGSDDADVAARLAIFAAAIVVIALLNYIPFVGWVANYTLVLLGTGAMTRAIFERLVGSPEPALDVDMRPRET